MAAIAKRLRTCRRITHHCTDMGGEPLHLLATVSVIAVAVATGVEACADRRGTSNHHNTVTPPGLVQLWRHNFGAGSNIRRGRSMWWQILNDIHLTPLGVELRDVLCL
jgi:hypothetical protein